MLECGKLTLTREAFNGGNEGDWVQLMVERQLLMEHLGELA
jgi:hypothetical protein